MPYDPEQAARIRRRNAWQDRARVGLPILLALVSLPVLVGVLFVIVKVVRSAWGP